MSLLGGRRLGILTDFRSPSAAWTLAVLRGPFLPPAPSIGRGRVANRRAAGRKARASARLSSCESAAPGWPETQRHTRVRTVACSLGASRRDTAAPPDVDTAGHPCFQAVLTPSRYNCSSRLPKPLLIFHIIHRTGPD